MVHQRSFIFISFIIFSLLHIVKSKDENDIKFASKQSGYQNADDAFDEDDDGKSDEDVDEEDKDENVKEHGKSDDSRNFYSFTVLDSEGKGVDLGKYKGKITLVVNVASECGYTDNHYKALSKIHNHLVTTGRFSVLAFPCNQFGKQEPGTNEEIQKFAKDRYRAKFPVFGKVNVIESDVSPAWQYLIDETGEAPSWNFFKYLVNENGDVLHAWGAWTSVDEIYSVVQEAVTNAMRRPKTEL
ncbi:glutathione peroxidase 7-like [Mytilus californianus]|uniref:glutathione peroxidase 7-like n=1 Tax=Mytilus californianus TaxID=6549 RepID=UPI0022470D5D|nr:glutathione peroxidase 7-like [Mytilus californianus]